MKKTKQTTTLGVGALVSAIEVLEKKARDHFPEPVKGGSLRYSAAAERKRARLLRMLRNASQLATEIASGTKVPA